MSVYNAETESKAMSNWTNLTDFEIDELREQDRFWTNTWSGAEFDGFKFALAIQEALRIKNEAAQ
jgi:hypothetical protein